MNLPVELILVRHGESEENHAHNLARESANLPAYQSGRNSRLTKKGQEQAKAAGKWIKGNAPSMSHYFTSEYVRASETAAYLGLEEARWSKEFALREREWGELEKLTSHERRVLEGRKADSFYWIPSGGESMAQLCLRINLFLESLTKKDMPGAIVVCHGEVIWAFRVLLERMPLDKWYKVDWSEHPYDHIYNCQILHYTRRHDPQKLNSAPGETMAWMRSINPWDITLSSNQWEQIEHRSFSNADLLEGLS